MLMDRMNIPRKNIFILAFLLFSLSATPVFAAGGAGDNPATAFIAIVVLLLVAKVSSLIERIGQPPVLGELIAGVVLGNLVLLNIHWFDVIQNDTRIKFLAQLGVVILLFQVGLETKIDEMRRVGVRAFLVACVGVAVPFFLGAEFVGPLLLPGLSQNAYILIGATLTATSVGITARVFRDLGKLKTREAQIVLGAAVIDDVLGLMILAVVVAMVSVGTIDLATMALITFKAVAFLVGAIFLGQLLAPRISQLFSKIHTGIGMKFTIAISFGLTLAYLADQIGLAPIVGAFAAGLVLESVHFRFFDDPKIADDLRAAIQNAEPETKTRVNAVIEEHANHHIEDLMLPIGNFLVPLFFVLTGMGVRFESFFNLPLLLSALGIAVVAFVGKICSGLVAGNVNKLIVGWGMIPRGEVGLIFVATGKSIGVVNDEIYSMLVIVIILSTLLTPPILTVLLNRKDVVLAPTG